MDTNSDNLEMNHDEMIIQQQRQIEKEVSIDEQIKRSRHLFAHTTIEILTIQQQSLKKNKTVNKKKLKTLCEHCSVQKIGFD